MGFLQGGSSAAPARAHVDPAAQLYVFEQRAQKYDSKEQR